MRRVNDREHHVNITGWCLWTTADAQPFLVELEGVLFLPLFSTAERARACPEVAAWTGPSLHLKQVSDRAEFLATVAGRVRVMIDPWITDQGNTRYVELVLGEGSSRE